ncbi:NADH-ubiquinone oxidoreductase 29.9 kd subunit precursor [Patellaria atrata CBS 101060]|uniref:NADH-ubiquinone oxidoreductase 29.9 kd subunit n=1 Tax=Patellaria atrata CBS 101060 TaxID=1346257 RepID=A0A9P4S2W1_9PEZI|nr:NADH-ubiquinone oxidoreductase 29.9 kd subunit precursor [Patellaria atrata CBS 101060]
MRAASRLLAAVKSGQYLQPGAPTGLTGLYTHPSPRTALLYHYNSTLEKLKRFPEHSVYRQATEALTKQRLAIVEAYKPPGWDHWHESMLAKIEDNPKLYGSVGIKKLVAGDKVFVNNVILGDIDERVQEWDGEKWEPQLEGLRSMKERENQAQALGQGLHPKDYNKDALKIEPEPQLTADQISEIESKIGAGLIEEVIDVAIGESKLAGEMAKAEIWGELIEKPEEGQWKYFERATHTVTQKP